MKKLLMSILAVAAFTFTVNAQEAPSPDEKAENTVDEIRANNDLNNDEAVMLAEVLADYFVQIHNASADYPDDAEKVMAIKENRDRKINDLFGHERAENILGYLNEE